MASPAVRSSIVTNGTTGTTTPVVNLPATISAGDTILVQIRVAVAGAISWPGGAGVWNELVDASPDGADDQLAIAWKKADGSEGGTTITLGSGNGKFAATAWAISGATDPTVRAPEISTVATGVSPNQPNATTVTPTGGSKDYLFGVLYSMEGEQTGVTTYPTNYTLGQLFANSGTAGAVTTNVTAGGAFRQATAASEDPGGWTVAGTLDDWSAYAIAFHPSTTQSVSGAHKSSSVSLFSGTVTVGAVSVSGAHRASSAQLFAGAAKLNIVGATIASSAALFAGLASQVIAGAHLASSAALFAGVVTAGAVSIGGAHLSSGAQFFPGSSAYRITGAPALGALRTITLKPNGDGSSSGWTWSAGGSNFWGQVDEGVATHDGLLTTVDGTNGSLFLLLENPPDDFDPAGISAISLKIAYRRLNTGVVGIADSAAFTVRITRADELTGITSHVDFTPETSITVESHDLTPTGSHSLADWNGARLDLLFVPVALGGADASNLMQISALEVEITFAPTPRSRLFAGSASQQVAGAHRASSAQLFAGEVSQPSTTPAGYRSFAAFWMGGAASSGAGAQSVSGAHIASSAALFGGTVTRGSVSITGATIASSASLFPGTVTPGAVNVAGATIASTAALFPGSVSAGALSAQGAFIPSGAQFFTGIVTPGAISVTGAHISSSVALFAGTVTRGAVSIAGAHISSSLSLFPGTVTAGAVSIAGAHRASSVALFAGTVTVGAASVAGAHIPSGAQLFPGSAAVSGSIAGASIGPGAALFPGSVTTGAVSIAGAHISSSAALFPGQASPDQNVAGATIASSVQLFAGTVTTGAAGVQGATIGSTAALFPGQASAGAVTVQGAHLASSVQTFAGSVSSGGISVSGAHRASTVQLFAGTVTPGAISVTGAHRASSVQLFAGLVAPDQAIAGAHISSSAQLFAGSVTAGAASIQGAHIASSAVLFPGTVAAGAIDVAGAHIGSSVQLFPGAISHVFAQDVGGAHIPPGSELFPPAIGHALNICATEVVSLNPRRLVVSLNPERSVEPIDHPIRRVTRYCS